MGRLKDSRYKGGFTLAETLLTVAILGILAGISFVNVVGMQRSMNQLQADKRARVLFQEAEQRMNEIAAYDELLREQLSDENDAVVDSALNEGKGSKRNPKLVYLKQAKGAAKTGYLKSLDLSSEYDGFQYIIEYQPQTLDVTGVFVTESEAEFYVGRDAVDGLRSGADSRMAYVRSKGYDSPIGYYGKAVGEPVQSVPVINDSPIVCDATFEDGEELKAVFHAVIPDNKEIGDISANGYYVHVTVESVDSRKVVAFRASIPPTAFTTDGDIFTNTREAEFSVTIDGSGDYAFKNTFGQSSMAGKTVGTSAGDVVLGAKSATELSKEPYTFNSIKIEYDGYNSENESFIPGENLMITAYAEPIPDEGEGTQKSEKETAIANSLFAGASLESGVYRAEIANVRHLQNLDTETSGFVLGSLDTDGGLSASSMVAVVTENIRVAERNVATQEIVRGDDGEIVYRHDYPFTSIINENLKAFDGGRQYAIEGLYITPKAGQAAGLFSVFSGNSISNVTMKSCVIDGSINDSLPAGGIYRSGGLIGTWNIQAGGNTISGCSMQGVRVYGGTNVGGIVGGIPTSTGTVSIENCNLYMRPGIDFDDALTADGITKDNNNLWLSGSSYAGGLVGAAGAPLTINNSYAATVITAGAQAGGLVGMTENGVRLDVTKSYADCYISAQTIGGLAGSCANESTFTSCYSAGFVLNPNADTVAAKFVPNRNIKIGSVGGTQTSYSYFSFYDITKASATKSETDGDGNTVVVDSDVPNYDDIASGVVYCVTADGDHRVDNGFGLGEPDLEAMKLASFDGTDEPYALAAYFKAKETQIFNGPQAGLPHYGDFYDEPDEYHVKVVNNYDGFHEEQTMVYRSTGAHLLDDFDREAWERTGWAWRYYTVTENGSDADENIIGAQPENMIYGYLQRGDFTRSGEGLWTITRYIKWEPVYRVIVNDPKAANHVDDDEWSEFFEDEMEESLLSDYVLNGIMSGVADSAYEELAALSYDDFVNGYAGKQLKLLSITNGAKTYSAGEAKIINLKALIAGGWFDENRVARLQPVWDEWVSAVIDGETVSGFYTDLKDRIENSSNNDNESPQDDPSSEGEDTP